MARQRRDTTDVPPLSRPLRIIASGTLFLTHTLSLHVYPAESDAVRAQSVVRTRGGSATNVLSALAQFQGVDALLVAPLGASGEGRMLIQELEAEGVSTKYCKIWDGASAPSAWILRADDTGTRTVINHNPLPDITHEEFVSLLGPLLVPENYALANASPPPTSTSSPVPPTQPPSVAHASPAPFDWLHFEGRSVKTTLSNIIGIDGLAKERKWRSHCVFSLDVSRKSRQGVEALIPHADVIFFSKPYALSQSANYTTPRPFLLSLTTLAAPHALLVVHWGASGAALLSLPTREYFQSSGWVDDADISPTKPALRTRISTDGKATVAPGAGTQDDKYVVGSVRSGSGFWAAGHRGSGTSSSAYTAFSPDSSASPHHFDLSSEAGGDARHSHFPSFSNTHSGTHDHAGGDDAADGADGADSEGTETARHQGAETAEALDDAGAQDAFVAGMIYALSRRVLPGAPYTPSARGVATEPDRGRWKLEDCLRFASEMAGRKARRKGFGGLMEDMTRAGWFDA